MEINTIRRYYILVLMLVALPGKVRSDEPGLHPLEIHMNQWLVGSREWRTPNPDYKPPGPGSRDRGWKEFSVYWEWDAERKVMEGELSGISNDGSKTHFWSLYAFYNPVTERVLYLQVGRRGDLIRAEDPVRRKPLSYGEIERLDTLMFASGGSVKYARHENVFHENGTHTSNVFERSDKGEWRQVNAWTWTLTDQ